MYLEFLLRRAHSRRRVERMYWSGVSLYSFTTCSKEVMVGTTGPMGSGLPQLGLPRRFARADFPRYSVRRPWGRNSSFYHLLLDGYHGRERYTRPSLSCWELPALLYRRGKHRRGVSTC